MQTEVLFDSAESDLKNDAFGRGRFAQHLGSSLADLMSPKSATLDESFVISLTGAWGSGKTTVMEFSLAAMNEVAAGWPKDEQPIVHRFDPWLFNDPAQLLSAFLRSFGNTLSLPDHGDQLSKDWRACSFL